MTMCLCNRYIYVRHFLHSMLSVTSCHNPDCITSHLTRAPPTRSPVTHTQNYPKQQRKEFLLSLQCFTLPESPSLHFALATTRRGGSGGRSEGRSTSTTGPQPQYQAQFDHNIKHTFVGTLFSRTTTSPAGAWADDVRLNGAVGALGTADPTSLGAAG